MSKIENPKKLSQQKNQHLFTQCSEAFLQDFSKNDKKYYNDVV
jgi:hypothetical protein